MKKAKAEKLDVYSIIHVENVKGYLFVETSDENTLVKLIQKVKHVKGFLKRPVTVPEIENLVKAEKQVTVVIEPGDMVEMVSRMRSARSRSVPGATVILGRKMISVKRVTPSWRSTVPNASSRSSVNSSFDKRAIARSVKRKHV